MWVDLRALDRVVAELLPLYGASCPAAVVVRASWPDQRVVRATLATLCDAVERDGPIERTALVLVGPALGAEDFRDSALYDPGYRRRFRSGDAA